jgi:hypothetical protein
MMQKKLWSSSATYPSKSYKLPIQPAIQSLQMCNKTLTSHISDNPNIQNKTRIFYKTNTIANEKSRFLGCSMKTKERRTTRRMNARNQTPNPRIKP